MDAWEFCRERTIRYDERKSAETRSRRHKMVGNSLVILNAQVIDNNLHWLVVTIYTRFSQSAVHENLLRNATTKLINLSKWNIITGLRIGISSISYRLLFFWVDWNGPTLTPNAGSSFGLIKVQYPLVRASMTQGSRRQFRPNERKLNLVCVRLTKSWPKKCECIRRHNSAVNFLRVQSAIWVPEAGEIFLSFLFNFTVFT